MWLFIKSALFTLAAPGTAGIYLPRFLAARAGDAPAPGALRWLAAFPLGVGAAMYLRCAWDFAVVGRGTPAPVDAPRTLVVRGLYRAVRNPMYVGVLLMVAGWTLYYRSTTLAWYAAILWAGFHLFIVSYEEPALRSKFGDSYADYCRQVRRWVPRRPIPLRG